MQLPKDQKLMQMRLKQLGTTAKYAESPYYGFFPSRIA